MFVQLDAVILPNSNSNWLYYGGNLNCGNLES